MGRLARSRRFMTTSAILVFLPLLAGSPLQAQETPPTDPVVKDPVPTKPAQDKETKTPPPAPTVSPVQLPASLTLPQAIELALRLQPDIAAAVANREQAEQRKNTTYSRYYPRVTPTYNYLTQRTSRTVVQFIPGGAGTLPIQQSQDSTTTITNRQAQLTASINVLDSGERELSARQARQSLRLQQFNEANTRQVVIANVADNYFAVLRNEALVRVSEAQVARAQNTLDVVRAQVEVGVTAQKDILQAEADLLNAQVNLLTAQNNAAVAQANLKQAIGAVGGEPLQLAEVTLPTENSPVTALSGITAVPPPTPPGTGVLPGGDAALVNQLADAAYQNRPDIAATRQNVEVTRTSASLSRVETGVQVSLDLSDNEQFDPETFDNSIGRNQQISASISYPLFDGYNVRSQFRANQAAARAAEANLNGQRQQVSVEVEQSYRNLSQFRASLPASAAAVRAAQINYDAALESQREGVGSIVEVITAQTQLVQAQTNYVQAIYNFYAADARLTRAIGQADLIRGIGGTAPGNTSPVPIAPVPSATLPGTPPGTTP